MIIKINENIFYKINLLLFLSIIPLAMTGSFMGDLSLSLFALSSIIFIILFKKYKYIKNKYIYLYLIWLLYLLLLSLLSEFPILSLESSLFYFRFGALVFGACLLIDFYKLNFFNIFFKVVVIAMLTINLDALRELIFQKNIFFYLNIQDYQKASNINLTSFFGDKRVLGGFLFRVMPILFLSIIFFEKKNKFFFYVSFLVTLITIFNISIAGERTALVSLFLFIFNILIFLKRNYYIRVSIFISFIFFIFAIFIFNLDVKDKLIEATFNDVNFNNKILSINKNYKGLYNTAYLIFLDNPIKGTGPKTFREVCKRYSLQKGCSTHPHNFYLQLLSETGIVGTLPLILVFTICVVYFFKIFYKNFLFRQNYIYSNSSVILTSSVMVNLFPIIPNGNFFNNWLSILLYLPIIFLSFNKIFNKRLDDYL